MSRLEGNAADTHELSQVLPEADDGADDPRVVQALENYLRMLTDGPPPDRATFLLEHPEIAHWLAPQLSGLEFVHRATLSLSWPTLGPGCEASPGRVLPESATLGDYRIIREIGRGGMGVVYEAEQLSLGRRVALKVLPFAAALDQAQLQRFRHEAQIAAHFHHTHIVPVYAVGCERGVHFYAMQLIEGRTLADVIRELRAGQNDNGSESAIRRDVTADGIESAAGKMRPESTARLAAGATHRSISHHAYFRWIAQLGVQAAEALEHAHRFGVVHRDIKPANLLIDNTGNLWITDFGLARLQTDIGMTLSHDLVGTMRYMSPEQALGRRGVVDQRADVYALGTTLYELLTLRPVFDGSDRESILRQIAFDEPAPPRRWNRAIPADLEIIVMTMLAKEPAERFATAQELADDLRRFLEDRPIAARPPSPLQQVRKWSRRHRPVIATALVATGLLLMASVVGLAVSNRLIRHERDQKVAALRDRERALAAERENYRMAEQHRIQAEQNHQKVLHVAQELLANATADHSAQRQGTEFFRAQLLQQAQTFFEELIQPATSGSVDRFQNGQAYAGLRDVYAILGEHARALEAGREAQRLFEELSRESAGNHRYLEQSARASISLAALQFNLPEVRDHAPENFRQGAARWRQLVDQFPAEERYRREWMHCLHGWGYSLYSMRHMDEAEVRYREALNAASSMTRHVQDREFQARTYTSLGLLLRQSGRPLDAVRIHRESLAILRDLESACEDDATLVKDGFQSELLRALFHLNLAQAQLGEWDSCSKNCREGLALAKDRFHRLPYLPEVYLDLAAWHESTAECCSQLGRDDEAELHYREAVDTFDQALAQFSESANLHRKQIESLFRLGRFLSTHEQGDEADEIARRILAREPIDNTMRNELAWHLANFPDARFVNVERAVALARQAAELAPRDGMIANTLGVALFRAGNYHEAVAALDRSMQLLAGRSKSFNTFFLAMAHWQLDHKAESRRYFQQAVAWMDKNQPDDPELLRFRSEAAAMLQAGMNQPAEKSQPVKQDGSAAANPSP